MNGRERCLAALRGEKADRVPVFPLLMFFAQNRAGITYREFAGNGSAMAEAQLNCYEKFALDAITACSDAFRISADLGGNMAYPEDKPPYLTEPLVRNRADLDSLRRPDPLRPGSRMADRTKAVSEMVRAKGDECLVLGWVDMPFAELCSVCGVTEAMMLLVSEPELAHAILDFLTQVVVDFSLAQLDAGAPMIGAGDAAASLISPAHYREFALPYERRVVEAVHAAGGLVKLHICGNTSALLDDMVRSGADLFNVDHLVAFDRAVACYSKAGRCFKGNLDPVSEIMQVAPEQCREKALRRIAAAAGCRYMLSAGCEIPAETTDATFDAFCKAPQAARG